MSKKEKIKEFVKENKKELAIAGFSALVGGFVVYKMTVLSADEKMLLKVVKKFGPSDTNGSLFITNLTNILELSKDNYILVNDNRIPTDKLGDFIIDRFKSHDWDLNDNVKYALLFTDK